MNSLLRVRLNSPGESPCGLRDAQKALPNAIERLTRLDKDLPGTLDDKDADERFELVDTRYHPTAGSGRSRS